MSELVIVGIFGFLTLMSLIIGIVLFARGKKLDGKMGNKLMIARVVFQALTIAALAIIVYLWRK